MTKWESKVRGAEGHTISILLVWWSCYPHVIKQDDRYKSILKVPHELPTCSISIFVPPMSSTAHAHCRYSNTYLPNYTVPHHRVWSSTGISMAINDSLSACNRTAKRTMTDYTKCMRHIQLLLESYFKKVATDLKRARSRCLFLSSIFIRPLSWETSKAYDSISYTLSSQPPLFLFFCIGT